MRYFQLVPFSATQLTNGFWQYRQQINREVSVHAVHDRFQDTGRFDAFRFDWKEGEPFQPHIYWDSDVYKWIEAAAYILHQGEDAQMEAIVDETVALIERHQDTSGYFNSYFQVVEPAARFTQRNAHELYCAGHMMEAAVAYYRARGKDTLLRCACRMADCIERAFVIEKTASFVTPGHEEIELALVRLYECTGEERYLRLSRWFLDKRGTVEEGPLVSGWDKPSYSQSHLPVRQQTTAEGHSVRACYLYSGMADVARETGDEALAAACRALFENIAHRRMYITGGVGSTREGEAFTFDYDLPNETAYAESCAAISLAMFARRMSLIEPDGLYADVAERILYNNFLSSVSLDGRSFFYTNPLAITRAVRRRNASVYPLETVYPETRRSEVFDCSCCPPNVVRFLASIADYLYTYEDTCLYIHQFMAGRTAFSMGGAAVCVTQETTYPLDGTVRISLQGMKGKRAAVRIPGWCERYTLSVDGTAWKGQPLKGYAYIDCLSQEVTVELMLAMPVQLVETSSAVWENVGRAAVCRGPVVYCAEEVDNGANLHALLVDCAKLQDAELVYDEAFHGYSVETAGFREMPFEGLYAPKADRRVSQKLRLIPYFSFANREECDMLVWLRTANT